MHVELAQARQRHALEHEHFTARDADAVALAALNRELSERLGELEARLGSATLAMRAAEAREREAVAARMAVEGRHDLARLLAHFSASELKALAETQSDVSKAIQEQLLPALEHVREHSLPALARQPPVAPAVA